VPVGTSFVVARGMNSAAPVSRFIGGQMNAGSVAAVVAVVIIILAAVYIWLVRNDQAD
jgi:hypothetical protein